MKSINRSALSIAVTLLVSVTAAQAQVVRIDEAAFNAQAGLITFSEKALGSVNPVYTAAEYGGSVGAPTVSFGGFFTGQSLGTVLTCPTGAAVTGCVTGLPTGVLSLSGLSPLTSIVGDGSNPTSPVLSGTPLFNGPVSILFDRDMAGVGLDGGYFNSIGGTAITAFARDGSVIGSVSNTTTGIEFLGLVTADGSQRIAGLQYTLVGAEPAGFAIDNLRFGLAGQVVVPVPEPESYAMMVAGLGVLGMVARRRRRQG